MPRSGAPSTYQPLVAWLHALPADQHAAVLSLVGIETLIGAALPPGAGTTGIWTGTTAAHRRCQSASFRARREYSAKHVQFTRTQ
jgi:hypothetical protein